MPRKLVNPITPALREARNKRQKAYHDRLKACQVKPFVLVGPKVLRQLLASGRLQENHAADRRRVGEAVSLVLADWADRFALE
jgi:hypothetical protein